MSRVTDRGWNQYRQSLFASHAASGTEPGRAVGVRRGVYELVAADARVEGVASRRMRHLADLTGGAVDLPAARDWVVLRRDTDHGGVLIEAVPPRTSVLSRKETGARAVDGARLSTVSVNSALS